MPARDFGRGLPPSPACPRVSPPQPLGLRCKGGTGPPPSWSQGQGCRTRGRGEEERKAREWPWAFRGPSCAHPTGTSLGDLPAPSVLLRTLRVGAWLSWKGVSLESRVRAEEGDGWPPPTAASFGVSGERRGPETTAVSCSTRSKRPRKVLFSCCFRRELRLPGPFAWLSTRPLEAERQVTAVPMGQLAGARPRWRFLLSFVLCPSPQRAAAPPAPAPRRCPFRVLAPCSLG